MVLQEYIIPVLVAGIVACGPTILAVVNNRQRARDKSVDWARQDLVADRVAATAERAARAAELLVSQNERVVTAAEVTQAKLDEVHTIVNQQRSDMLSYQAVLLTALRAAGVAIPPDASLDPQTKE